MKDICECQERIAAQYEAMAEIALCDAAKREHLQSARMWREGSMHSSDCDRVDDAIRAPSVGDWVYISAMALSHGIYRRQVVQLCENDAIRCACGYYAKGEYHYTLDDAQKAAKRTAARRIISTRKKADRMVADLESIVKHGAKVTT